MDFEKIFQTAATLKETRKLNSEELGFLHNAYSRVQNEANLFPVNEIEEQRLWKMSQWLWYYGRAWQIELTENGL